MAVIAETYSALSAMLTPALLMLANASMVSSTSSRMSRIVDRIRVLNDYGDTLSRGETHLDFVDDRLDEVAEQILRLEWRANRIRTGLTILYVAISCFVGTSLTLGLDVVFAMGLPLVPTILALAGALLMLVACVNLALEAREALRSNRLEINFHRELRARRKQHGQ